MNENIKEFISLILRESEIKSLDISTAKDLFFNCLKIKNVSEDTIKYYKNIFYRLDDFMLRHEIKETSQINDDMLRKLINEGLQQNLSACYINKLIAACKYIINLLSKANYIDPVLFKVEKLKEVENRIDDLSNDEINLLLREISNMSLKHQLVVLLLLATGVRRTELVNIKLENIDFEKNCIILDFTKTKNIRTCFFTNEISLLIKKFVKVYQPKLYLFEASPGIHLKPARISKILEKIKVCLNLDKLSAHQFRHTFGTIIYNSSMDIELTRELLGHSNYNMTRRYIHNSKDKLKEKYDMFNPLKSF